jgi:hypothetical protein
MQRAVAPALGLTGMFSQWKDIAKGLAENQRKRRGQIGRLFPGG